MKAIVYLKVEINANADTKEELKEKVMCGDYEELDTSVEEIRDENDSYLNL